MKKILASIIEILKSTCFSFTITLCIFLLFRFISGEENMQVSYIFSILMVSIGAAILQFVAFSEVIFKKLNYIYRLCIFIFPFLGLITGIAFRFQWFPVEMAKAWILFFSIFVIIFIIFTIGFEIYFKITGRKFDGLLGEYKKNKER